MKLKSILAIALCAVGLSAWAELDAVQLWKDGPYFATSNLGTPETHDPAYPAEYGALYKFDDAGTAVKSLLGEEWRVPSKDDLNGLRDSSKCTKAKVTDDAGKFLGYTFTGAADGYTDKSIFLPAAGFNYNGSKRGDDGNFGCYWSSKAEDSDDAWYLVFSGSDEPYMSYDDRSDGYSVRAVRDTPPTPTPPEPSDEEVVATAEATFVLGPALAVANVTTATHWPWDGKIDVTCDLTGSGKVTLSAALTTNGVKVCDATAANVTGATTINLDAAGGVTNGVKFTWNAKADCPAGFNSTDTKVKVTAKKVVPPAGALPGEFSVSADKKVLFSQGNLVATIDVSGVPTAWKFAANQYDYLGEGGANKTIGSAAGDVDLFGWSASNNGGTLTTDNYGIIISENGDDYLGDFYDWGKAYCEKNSITPDNTWRTLSTEEWQYLFNYGSYTSEVRNGKYKYGVTVCGKAKCVVLLPDNWDETVISLANFATQNTYDENSTPKWSEMQAAGAVCLPAAGSREGSIVYSVGGRCWSSTAYDEYDAYLVYLSSGSVKPGNNDHRKFGFSVRLVTEVK